MNYHEDEDLDDNEFSLAIHKVRGMMHDQKHHQQIAAKDGRSGTRKKACRNQDGADPIG